MLMHSCCHILFIVLIDLIQSSKEIQKHLKLDLENQIRKRKLLFLSLPPFGPVGLLALFLARPRFSPSLSSLPRARWAGPREAKPPPRRSFPLLPLTGRARPSAPSSPTVPRPRRNHRRTCVASWASWEPPPRLGPFKGGCDPISASPCCPPRSVSLAKPLPRSSAVITRAPAAPTASTIVPETPPPRFSSR
jgi:hypothetical protein